MDKFTLVLGMALVTYLPRLLPFFLIQDQINKDFERFLKLIPYTALGGLIIPGIFSAIEGNFLAGFLGGLSALLVAWWSGNLVVTVLLSILATYLVMIL